MVGLSVVDFESMSFPQFQNAVAGYEKQAEVQEQRSWEQARWQSWCALLPHQKKNGNLKITDLRVFSWEQQDVEDLVEKTPEQLQEEYNEVTSFWNKIDNK